MKNIFIFLKKNLFLLLASIFFALSAVFAYIIFDTMGYFGSPDQTLVGTISVSGRDETQYSAEIASGVSDWRSDADFVVEYLGYEYYMDLSRFSLEIEATIDAIVIGENNSVVFSISTENRELILNELTVVYSANIMTYFDEDAFFEDIISDMGMMNILKHYELEDYFDDSVSETILSSVTIASLASADVTDIINLVESIKIEADARFSLLGTLGALELDNNQLSIIASGIQKVTSETPFSGFVFSQNTSSVDWVQEGMNVMILKANQYDLTFYNDLDRDYTIKIDQISDQSLSISLVGYPFVGEYSITQTDETIIPRQYEYYDNSDLDENTPGIIIIDTDEETIYRLLIESGEDGKIVCFTRTVTLPDLTVYTEIIYREIYYPTTEIYQENVIEK